MNTGFAIVSGQTVPSTYTWDLDVPFSDKLGTSVNVTQTIPVISGYAPGLRVVFKNNSSNEYAYNITEKYEWNFGDYYNSSSNIISLPCSNNVEHVYVMPGTYNVTITHTRYETPIIFDPSLRHCQGLYNYQWYWDNLMPGLAQSVKWDDLLPGTKLTKIWGDESACFDKYCSFWSWANLASGGANPYTWDDTSKLNSGNYPKKWDGNEGNTTICKDTTATVTQVISSFSTTLIGKIQVIELPPTASLAVVNPLNNTLVATTYGISPLTVQLTPRTIVAGSFPIDRIDWDLGDGSELLTITRYTTADASIFKPNNQFINDPLDPRNYDVVYTYKRNKNQHWLFYPSLTAYASSTGTHDTASIEIGPINLQSFKDTDVKVVKVRNTPSGNIYTLDVNGNIAFATTNSDVQKIPRNIVINTPPNPLVTSINDFYVYKGNPGTNYPPIYNLSCTLSATTFIPIADTYIVEEDGSTPILLEDAIDPNDISYDNDYIYT
jgi:hypothetical protein